MTNVFLPPPHWTVGVGPGWKAMFLLASCPSVQNVCRPFQGVSQAGKWTGEGVVGVGGSVTLGEIGVFCVDQGVKGDQDLGNV